MHLLGFAILLIALLVLSNVFAQGSAQWRLPEGAKAPFGKGWITDIKGSPTGDLVPVKTGYRSLNLRCPQWQRG